MIRSVLAAAAIICLAASAASAQMPEYWLATPPSIVNPPLKVPRPQIPQTPFAPMPNVPIVAIRALDRNFKLIAPWPPLWLGSDEVALLGARGGKLTLMVWYGEHFNHTRVLADPSTVKGERILEIAASPDGKRIAIAAATQDKLDIWIRDSHDDAPAVVVASADGNCERAGMAWLGADTLAIGAESKPLTSPSAEQSGDSPPAPDSTPPAQPTHSVHLVQLGPKKQTQTLDLACLKQLDVTRLSWSPDARYAIGPNDEQHQWFLIDRTKGICEPLKMPAIIPGGFIEWEKDSGRFLFTATPLTAPNPAHLAVMEYSIATRRPRLLAGPAAVAVYAGKSVAVLGSNQLSPAMIVSHPEFLVPAQIAWINAERNQITIVPTGLGSSAAALFGGALRYGPRKRMLAASFQTPGPKGAFPVLLWISALSHTGGILGAGQPRSWMIPSWAPDGARLAVIAGLPHHPTLAIVPAP